MAQNSSKPRGSMSWDGPPPPPDPKMVAKDLSCQGIIALSLQEALKDIKKENDEIVSISNLAEVNGAESAGYEKRKVRDSEREKDGSVDQASETSKRKRRCRISEDSIASIMQSFGEAVAHSHIREFEETYNHAVIPTSNGPGIISGPAALFRGRLDHYNRQNNKWRLVVHDAEIMERNPLDRNRRLSERPSLWHVACNESIDKNIERGVDPGDITLPILKLKTPVELLLYNDSEP